MPILKIEAVEAFKTSMQQPDVFKDGEILLRAAVAWKLSFELDSDDKMRVAIVNALCKQQKAIVSDSAGGSESDGRMRIAFFKYPHLGYELWAASGTIASGRPAQRTHADLHCSLCHMEYQRGSSIVLGCSPALEGARCGRYWSDGRCKGRLQTVTGVERGE